MKTRTTQHSITPKRTRVYLDIRPPTHLLPPSQERRRCLQGSHFCPVPHLKTTPEEFSAAWTFHNAKACLKKRRGGAGNSPAQPLAGGDAGHDDALGSRGGHSLERPLPKLLKEQLLLQLRPQRQRGAAVGKLKRTRGLHLRTRNLGVLTRAWRSAHEPAWSCPGTEARLLALRVLCSQRRASVAARLSTPGS